MKDQDTNVQEILRLARQGKTHRQIARIIGKSQGCVKHWLKKNNIKTDLLQQRRKTSSVWIISKQELQKILDQSSSKAQVLIKIGLEKAQGSNNKSLNKRIQIDNLDMSRLLLNKKQWKKKHYQRLAQGVRISDQSCFCENSSIDRGTVKRRIIQNNIIPYQCKCGNNGEWQGKKLSLQLDHINGVNNDHRLQNLRFLCPNCHSQTETFGTKGLKKKFYCACGRRIIKSSKKCRSCESTGRTINVQTYMSKRKFNPSKLQLCEKMQQFNYNYCKVGRFFGVSDNSIRKRAKLLGIENKKHQSFDQC